MTILPPHVMPIKPPPGFVTRPQASTLYNRSQRALERDLNIAIATQDQEELAHWKLVTKDGTIRAAEDVTTEQVKQLVKGRETPAWCVDGSYLEQRFGLKGSPGPPKSQRSSSTEDSSTGNSEPATDAANQVAEENGGAAAESPSWPSDVEFLQDRIRTLEREKQQEAARYERREAKLFEQLDVKDRQISAWDEVTQGLTRGLATGQLIPILSAGGIERRQRESSELCAAGC